MSAEMVKAAIKGRDYLLLVVTPAILENYFLTSQEAELSDFTLIIFDEVHHAKKRHEYNILIHRYLTAMREGHQTPQVYIIYIIVSGIGAVVKVVDSHPCGWGSIPDKSCSFLIVSLSKSLSLASCVLISM